MVASLGVVAILAAAIVTLAVAALVLFLDFEQRVHRAFALFLILRAMLDGMLVISQDTGPGYDLRMYWFIAIPFAALHFCLAYRRRHGSRPNQRPQWGAPLLILAVALVFETLYLLDHDLFRFGGPFASFQSVRILAYAGVAWVFAAELRHATSAASKRAMVLASIGFALTPLYYACFVLANAVQAGAFAVTVVNGYMAVSVLLIGDTARRLVAKTWGKARLGIIVTFMACLLLCGANLVVFGQDAALGQELLRVIVSATALAVPICITYALVKHRLFDIEVRLRFAIRGTTLAGLFLAVFFIVNKVTENLVASRFENEGVGIYVGGAVAGLLLFALNPLQRLADRIAQKAVPQVPSGLSTTDREQLYREQLEIAWRDGRLTAKERLLFGRLQGRLGIAASDAARLETEVLQALHVPNGRRRRPVTVRA